MSKPQFEFSGYYTYEQITEELHDLSEQNPSLVSVESIGKSHEGRDVWLVTVTDRETGCPDSKPAHYLDANHHAGEVTGSMVILYLIRYLADNYGIDESITRLLRRCTHYLVPRVSPDGSEKYLNTPHALRSSVRPWPKNHSTKGLQPEDINGDDLILQMRVPNPDGAWRISDEDPRLMVRRDPDEEGGEYYDLLTEGIIEGYDGVTVDSAPPRWGLDFNRNYPANWKDARQQRGAGPYPLSEPETHNIAGFFSQHPNIAAATSYHTTGGIYLRPPCIHPDGEMNYGDLRLFAELGRLAAEHTGYPCESVFDAMTLDKSRPHCGSFIDFAYEMHGLVAFAPELWNLRQRAGIPQRSPKDRYLMSPAEKETDDLKTLQWLDEHAPGSFHPWTPFEHPQLGQVEIGGVEGKFTLVNPPVDFLSQECHKNAMAALTLSKALPRLAIDDFTCRRVSDTVVYVLSAAVSNRGWLGTWVTSKGRQQGDDMQYRLYLPDAVEVIKGKTQGPLPHLAGRSSASERRAIASSEKLEWVVKGPQRALGELRLEIRGRRAGVCTGQPAVMEDN